MARKSKKTKFNIAIVVQSGRLQYEALLFLASLRHTNPGFEGRIFLCEPQAGPRWDSDPTVKNPDIRAMLEELGGTFLPFANTHFGQSYPHGNKIECLTHMPKDEPFVFFDTDTLITGDLMSVPFDFSRPSASLQVEGTWPKPEIYGPGYAGIWKSLYDKFGLDFDSTLDLEQPDEYWRRYLYFNAGFFYYSCPHEFGSRFLEYALAIKKSPPEALACQSLDPWLDQVALPLVIHSFGGGRDSLDAGYLDGSVSCHYRFFPLLYAREGDEVIDILETVAAPNKIKKLLKNHEAIKRIVFQGRGHKVRALFDRDHLPRREQVIRNRIKSEGFWMR